MKIFSLDPVDTCFFRDGTPYSMETGPQIDTGGFFPPSPFSIAGALRATLASTRGWNGSGRWPKEYNKILGDGPADLGQLRICGPFLMKDKQLLWPAPRHLWRKDNELGLAQPGAPAVCDLGEARLPVAPAGASFLARKWMQQAAFEALLEGTLPCLGDLKDEHDLWREERRIGIQRDPDTRTVIEGMLYSSRHFRLAKDTSLLAGISGSPDDWPIPNGAYPFGGEARLAWCEEWQGMIRMKMPLARICDQGRFVLIALTPLDLGREACLGREPIDELAGARVVSACMDRPMRIGGWDSLSRQSRPMHSYVRPGTVLFCECPDGAGLRTVIEKLLQDISLPAIGQSREFGFGSVALGVWA